ncbi:ABC transporter type 1, transmembrane domain-containing protein [Aspergillus heterothallicus]
MGVLLAKFISELSKPDTDSMNSGANSRCLIIFVVSLVQLGNLAGQEVVFAICSERLVKFHKDISFFDLGQNKTSTLTSLLTVETQNLSGISGTTLGTILMSFTTLIASMTIVLAIGWKIALVCLSAVSVLLSCEFYKVWMIAKFTQRFHEAYKQSSAFASEAVSSVRIIASLANREQIARRYEEQLISQQRKSFI